MLVKLDEYGLNEIKKAEKEIGKCKTINIGEYTYIEAEELLSIIENLNYELEHTQEKFRDFVQDVNDNFKRVSQAEQFDISDRDFI